MCGIAGFCDFTSDLELNAAHNEEIAGQMGQTLKRRGPDDDGTYVNHHVAFAHTRLAVMDPKRGAQPMKKNIGCAHFVIVYNGELYNTDELRNDLIGKGYVFETTSDTEVLLLSYVEYGTKCVERFNGIFAFAIWDSYHESVFLCRDRFGVKPLFYTMVGERLVFASEIKGILKYPGIKRITDRYGICELFGLGPAKSPGCGVYQGIHDLPPAHAMYMDRNGIRHYCYWKLEAKEHTESYEKTVDHTREILFDAINRQLISDVPLCTLLSGGLDSSVVSAVAAKKMHDEGRELDTFSFDYEGNSKFFQASNFQPTEDRPYVDLMVKHIGSRHHYLECSQRELADCLYDAVLAKDLPGMADVDSSLLYFAKLIKQTHTVSLSGECADEIFGGYPWFRDEEVLDKHVFPWSKNLDYRKEILRDDILEEIPIDEYVQLEYEKTMERTPQIAGESKERKREREISYLNTSWFMTTLLDRKDRMTMYQGLEVRVPFADHRLIEYLYNIPWEYKYKNEEVKALLKGAAAEILPDAVIHRKKCPYPKTYHPEYEAILKERLSRIVNDSGAKLNQLVDTKVIKKYLESKSEYKIPWFGQLMATPQLFAYLIEVEYWLEKYEIGIEI
ncbi:asparagine synthetase [glutamine-hydrolyzing] [Lachnospiraceae bacterium KM106-2]|nr:asparagine synthetase [glutamine-hydrolyzing] [Lachnospiraceae bacterium KM106-2]